MLQSLALGFLGRGLLGGVGSLCGSAAFFVLTGQLGNFLGHINAGEQSLALVHRVAVLGAVGQALILHILCGKAQLLGHFGGGVGQVGGQQGGSGAQSLAQMVQYAFQTGLAAFVLGQCPGGVFVNVLVGALHYLEDFGQCLGDQQLVHVLGHAVSQIADHFLQLGIQCGIAFALIGHSAAKVLFAHGHAAAQQVAQIVCQIAVDAVDQSLVGKHTVIAEGNLAQQEIADGIHAVALAQHLGVDHVAHALAHLAAVHQQPAVAEHLAGQG